MTGRYWFVSTVRVPPSTWFPGYYADGDWRGFTPWNIDRYTRGIGVETERIGRYDRIFHLSPLCSTARETAAVARAWRAEGRRSRLYLVCVNPVPKIAPRNHFTNRCFCDPDRLAELEAYEARLRQLDEDPTRRVDSVDVVAHCNLYRDPPEQT